MPKPERLEDFQGQNATVDTMRQRCASGTAVYGGFIVEDETKSALSGINKYKTYTNNMLSVGIIAASVIYFLNLISKPAWKADPADDSPEARRIADLFNDMLCDMDITWERVVKRAAMFKFYGFSVQEWTAKLRDDGIIGIKSIDSVSHKTIEQWDVDKQGNVYGFIQRAPQDGEEIYVPRSKTIYIVDDAIDDSPQGLGLFRLVAEAARRLQKYEQLEGQGFETDLRGVPVGRAPLTLLKQLVDEGKMTQAQADAIVAPLKNFITNHVKSPSLGAVLDSQPYTTEDEKMAPSGKAQWDLDLLKAASSSQAEMNNAITRKNQEISRTMGTENLMTGNDGRGSQSLSRDKSKNFSLTVDGALKELAKAMTQDLIRPIGKLNGWPSDKLPTFKAESIQFRDVEDITAALRDLAQSGAPLDINDPIVNDIRDMLGMSKAPERSAEDEIFRRPVPEGELPAGANAEDESEEEEEK